MGGQVRANPKKIIVAMSRTFAVDGWRVRTGRCKAEALGLKLLLGHLAFIWDALGPCLAG
ncbi:MAG: hypothetical protein C5B50_17780 [Verrucomicrobia bacterium]|nr:MAG: hypothetical protein C5B50_17780 [Verrucomicrobiota bacterium]